MRILHVLDHSLPLHSGYAFRSAAILREQRRLGWDTAQITGPKHGAGTAPDTVDGVEYARAPHTSALLGRVPVLNQVDVVMALRRGIAEVAGNFRPDIIQAHSPCLNGLAAAAVARRLGVPFVYELRASWEDAAVSHGTTSEGSPRYRLSRALETHVAGSAAAVTTICEGLRQDLVSRGVPAGRIRVIPNAVDIGQFSASVVPDPGLKARFCGPDGELLGFFGSFYAYEGLDLLVRAMPDILGPRPGVHLLLVGGGPEESRLQRLVADLGIGGAVTFLGRVPQREMPGYYAVTDLLVYPRRRNRLTDLVTPLKPLEAMAQQRIVVASDVGGHRELVTHGETGFLFAPDDPQAIARSVLATLARPDLDDLRRRARRYVEEERTWARSVAHYAPLYEDLRVRGGAARQPADVRG